MMMSEGRDKTLEKVYSVNLIESRMVVLLVCAQRNVSEYILLRVHKVMLLMWWEVNVCICVCLYVCRCVCVWVYVCIHACMGGWMNKCVCVCVYVCNVCM